MPKRVWLYLTALLYDRTSASCMALAEVSQTVSHDGWTRMLQADRDYAVLLSRSRAGSTKERPWQLSRRLSW